MTGDEFVRLLKEVSDCFISQDFDAWRRRMCLPVTMLTKDGPVVMQSEDALRDNFELYLRACHIMGLDAVVRTPVGLEDCRDGTWIGTYRTDLMRGRTRKDSYTSSALLKWCDGRWRIISILNARGHHFWTGEHPIKEKDV